MRELGVLVLRDGRGGNHTGVVLDHAGALVLRLLADPLIDFTPDTGEPRPAAAASWEVDEDGERVVFRLRPNVRFHHGRVVTAEDYVYSLTRVVRPERRPGRGWRTTWRWSTATRRPAHHR
jgi:ABC-type transport system substrate-binding protein